MLDLFLDAAYSATKVEQEKRAFVENLKKLPRADLVSLATGEKKIAHLGCDDGESWLDRFKGTELFEQAVALEQQNLELEAQRIQERMQQPPPDQIWMQQDQIRLQKKLLELQLIQSEGAALHTAAAPMPAPNTPPSPEAGAQGAGAVGGEELDNTEAVHNRPVGSPGLKTGSIAFLAAKMKLAGTGAADVRGFSRKVKSVGTHLLAGAGGVAVGGALERHGGSKYDDEGKKKKAMDAGLLSKLEGAAKATKNTAMKFKPGSLPRAKDLNAEATGLMRSSREVKDPFPQMKAAMTDLARRLAQADGEKVAFLPPGLASAGRNVLHALGPQAGKALIGAGVGAAGGAVMGGHDRQGWHPGGMLAGALGGAAVGGAAGHVGGNIAASMAKGAPLGQAAAAGVRQSGQQAMAAGREVANAGKNISKGLPANAQPDPFKGSVGLTKRLPQNAESLQGPKAPVV